jgi:hypothetical protein
MAKNDTAATAGTDDLTSGTKVSKVTGKPAAKKTTAVAKTAPTKAAKSAPVATKVAKGEKVKADAKPKADKPKQVKADAAARRESYAGRKITVLVKPGDAGFREGSGRAVRFELVAKAKNTDDVLGKEATDSAGNVSTISGAHLAFFAANEYISLSDQK